MKLWSPIPLLLLVACKSTAPADALPPDGGATGGGGGAVATGGAGGATALSLVETYARAGAVAGSCMPDDGINRNVARLWDPLPAASCCATQVGVWWTV